MEEGEPLVSYGTSGDECDGATFARVCPTCSRFVKADAEVTMNAIRGPKPQPNATCRFHGRVQMPFVGYY